MANSGKYVPPHKRNAPASSGESAPQAGPSTGTQSAKDAAMTPASNPKDTSDIVPTAGPAGSGSRGFKAGASASAGVSPPLGSVEARSELATGVTQPSVAAGLDAVLCLNCGAMAADLGDVHIVRNNSAIHLVIEIPRLREQTPQWPHPSSATMPFKKGKLHCSRCAANGGNIQDDIAAPPYGGREVALLKRDCMLFRLSGVHYAMTRQGMHLSQKRARLSLKDAVRLYGERVPLPQFRNVVQTPSPNDVLPPAGAGPSSSGNVSSPTPTDSGSLSVTDPPTTTPGPALEDGNKL